MRICARDAMLQLMRGKAAVLVLLAWAALSAACGGDDGKHEEPSAANASVTVINESRVADEPTVDAETAGLESTATSERDSADGERESPTSEAADAESTDSAGDSAALSGDGETPAPAGDTGRAAPTVAPTRQSAPPPPPAPTRAPPPPQATSSAVAGLSLASARLAGGDPVEVRDTIMVGGREQFAEPSAPANVAWYERFGTPGQGGGNSLFAAHINYVNHGNGPFAYLTSATVGDLLHVQMADGRTYSYSVQSVEVVSLSRLDMNEVVWPAVPDTRERITLISCGGTFVPNASGIGGNYDSRVILVAERYV